jgi:hypothetical protein
MKWIGLQAIAYINPLHTQGNSNNQQCMQLIFTIHTIEFHTQREITRVYSNSQKSHIFSYSLVINID